MVSVRAERPWLFHLALAAEWQAAQATCSYERSTVGKSLREEGFIHCSFAGQVRSVADLFYAGRGDVVLLRIDPRLVPSEIRVENLDGGTIRFPHIYGPLPVAAVVRAEEVPADADGRLVLEPLLGPSAPQ